MTYHRGHPVTTARHEALRSPLPAHEQFLPADAGWLHARAALFRQAAERPFELTLDPADYSRRTGLAFHTENYVAHVYRGEDGNRLVTPLMIVNLALVPTRAAADRALAHEAMHLLVPSYGHKQAAFARAQAVLDRVGALTA